MTKNLEISVHGVCIETEHSEFAYDNYLSLPLLRKCRIDSGWTRQTETVEIMYSTTMCNVQDRLLVKGKRKGGCGKGGKGFE